MFYNYYNKNDILNRLKKIKEPKGYLESIHIIGEDITFRFYNKQSNLIYAHCNNQIKETKYGNSSLRNSQSSIGEELIVDNIIYPLDKAIEIPKEVLKKKYSKIHILQEFIVITNKRYSITIMVGIGNPAFTRNYTLTMSIDSTNGKIINQSLKSLH